MPEIPFADFGLKWFEDILAKLIEWSTKTVISGLRTVKNDFFSTPLPEGSGTELIFGAPPSSDEPWHSIYESVVAGEAMIFALIILFLFVQGRHFVRIFNFSSAYADRRTKRSAWTGAVLIISWYWVAVLLLYLIDGLTIGLIPDVSVVTHALIAMLPQAAGNPIVTLFMAGMGGLAMLALRALYFIREVLLYVFLYGMPFGIAFAFGNIPVLSRIARRLCLQFIPLAILPLPAVILFRGYELLFAGEKFVTPSTPFLQYLVVVSLPVLALWVTWKTFRYASPLTARVIGTGSRAALTIGAIAGTGYVAGPYAATTAARWGARAGISQAAAQHVFSENGTEAPAERTRNDNVANGGGRGGIPEYRRSENDPSYY